MQKSQGAEGFMLSTRETFSRSFQESGVVVGQGDTIEQAFDNLAATARGHNADAVIAIRMLCYAAPRTFVAYGTLIRWMESK